MSFYLGCDLDCKAIHLVLLEEDTDRAEYVRLPLPRPSSPEMATVERCRAAKLQLVQWVVNGGIDGWNSVLLAAIERPMGPHRQALAELMALHGAVAASIPARVPVWALKPGEWREACGLPYKASKAEVYMFALRRLGHKTPGAAVADLAIWGDWPQDACDAYAVAWAAREINQKAQAA